MRTEISFKLICATCGSDLEADSDEGKTKMKYNSAYLAESIVAIKPCASCMREATRPVELMRQAIDAL